MKAIMKVDNIEGPSVALVNYNFANEFDIKKLSPDNV